MRLPDRLRAALGGVLAGAAGGLFGVGGGILLVPLLTALGSTQHQAHGTSLAVIGVTALAGVGIYGAHGNVAWVTAAIMALTSVITAPLGARLANRLSSTGLKRVFAVFLLFVGARLMIAVPEIGLAAFHRGFLGVVFDLTLGAAVGLLAGLMGVGGGILAVPALTLVLGLPQQTAQGTSLAVILLTGPAGALEHARHGNVRFDLVPALAAGALLGAPLASWLAQVLPHEILVRGFALFLIVNAIVGLWKVRPVAATPTAD